MLNVSIVFYKHGWSDVASLIETLFQSTVVDNIYIIDNSPTPSEGFQKKGIQYIFTGKNIGYGSAHNIALRKTINNDIPYHLVVNPDIQFDAKILDELIHFMEAHPVIGHLMPKVVYPDGNIQYLCKLLP